MIRSRMKSYSIEGRDSGVDEYGQPYNSFAFLKTVDISVTLLTKTLNETDVRYVDSTHIGLTFDKTLKDGMRITSDGIRYYMIKLVNNDGRMSQLTLQEV